MRVRLEAIGGTAKADATGADHEEGLQGERVGRVAREPAVQVSCTSAMASEKPRDHHIRNGPDRGPTHYADAEGADGGGVVVAELEVLEADDLDEVGNGGHDELWRVLDRVRLMCGVFTRCEHCR